MAVYVIVEGKNGFHVEPFVRERHLGSFGFLLPGVTLSPDMEDEQVENLLDQILD
jgi:hypothetical protein